MDKCPNCKSECNLNLQYQCENCGEKFWLSKEAYEKNLEKLDKKTEKRPEDIKLYNPISLDDKEVKYFDMFLNTVNNLEQTYVAILTKTDLFLFYFSEKKVLIEKLKSPTWKKQDVIKYLTNTISISEINKIHRKPTTFGLNITLELKNGKETTLTSAEYFDQKLILLLSDLTGVEIIDYKKTKSQKFNKYLIYGLILIVGGIILAVAASHFQSGGRVKLKGNILAIILESVALVLPPIAILTIFCGLGALIIAIGAYRAFLIKK